MPDQEASSTNREIAVLTVSRLFLNTGLRSVYPFLPAVARGLGVPIESLAILVSLRGFTSLLGPLFSPLSERYGRRVVLLLAIVVFSIGCLSIVIWPAFWIFGISLSLIALAKVIYDPAMQAYLGDRIKYGHRGRAIAITEMSWAGSFLLGVPVIGFVMERHGWQAPYAWLAGLGLLAAFGLWKFIPSDDGRPEQSISLHSTWLIIHRNRVIWATGLYIFLVMGANELLLIIYGQMMELNFSLTLTSLGLATAVIGGAEISGEVTTALFVDRLGKRRFVIATGILTCLMYLVIPFSNSTLSAALTSLFILFFFFEMTVVGGVPLMTELVPSARSVVMSVVLACAGLGRGFGALLGPRITDVGGFTLLGVVAPIVMALGIIILVFWIREASEENE